jgi:hypothetical protein
MKYRTPSTANATQKKKVNWIAHHRLQTRKGWSVVSFCRCPTRRRTQSNSGGPGMKACWRPGHDRTGQTDIRGSVWERNQRRKGTVRGSLDETEAAIGAPNQYLMT